MQKLLLLLLTSFLFTFHTHAQSNTHSFNPHNLIYPEYNGWMIRHPKNQYALFFKTSPDISCTKPFDPTKKYVIEYKKPSSSGFLYVKWDQKKLDQEITFSKHLDEMLASVKKSCPGQVITSKQFHLQERYAYAPGFPYYLLTVAYDDVLVGFAIYPAIFTSPEAEFKELRKRTAGTKVNELP